MSSDDDTEGITSEQLIAKYQNIHGQIKIKALEGIDNIDWSKLNHAHGEASNFPILLLATFSENKRDREFAFILLFETIWHQGTVYEASAYAVPFLFKALESPETLDKSAIAHLLSCLADGSSGLQVHAMSDKESENLWREILAKDNLELETEIAKEIEYVNKTRKAVGDNLQLLYPYLLDEHVSGNVATTLALYPEKSTETIPLLEKAQDSIKNEFSTRAIQSALAELRESNGS
jgi:hypothetical protein